MVNQTNVRNITLSDLWRIFKERLWLIMLVAILVTVGIWIVGKMLITPKYESTATLYICRQDGESTSSEVSSDFSLALKVVNDCTYMLKSHTVLDAVIAQLGLEMDYNTLYESISTYNPSDTRILEVSVQHVDPEKAKQIVDVLCENGAKTICEAMGFEQVTLYEYGTINFEQQNGIGVVSAVLAGIIAVMLVYGICLISFFVDDRIRDRDDVEKYLELSVLGDIPSAGDSGKKGKYMYGKSSSSKNQRSRQERRKGL